MNKRQKKKQENCQQQFQAKTEFKGRKRVYQKAKIIKNRSAKSNGGNVDYLDYYRQKIKDIEQKYNNELDNYIQLEIERRNDEITRSEKKFDVEFIDYVKELNNIGINVDESEVRVIPNLTEVAIWFNGFIEDFQDYMDSMPKKYIDSEFYKEMFDAFEERLKKHYVDNQENPKKLRNFRDPLIDYIMNEREAYINDTPRSIFFN